MTYEEEGKELMEECIRRRQAIIEQYRERDQRHHALDGRPSDRPLAEVSAWFNREVKMLRKKYGLPIVEKIE